MLVHYPFPSFEAVFIHTVNASVNSTCAQPPPGYCGAFARLVSPGGGAFANFALPGGRAFANPRTIPELLTRNTYNSASRILQS